MVALMETARHEVHCVPEVRGRGQRLSCPTYCWIRASRWRTARDKVKVKTIRSLTVPPDFEGGTLRQSSLVESC